MLRLRGLDGDSEMWLYIVVGNYTGEGDEADTKIGLDAFFIQGLKALSRVRLQWAYKEADFKDDTCVHVDKQNGIVGIDWRRLMDAFLTSSSSTITSTTHT